MILGILRDRLLTSSAVTDLVEARVYPHNIPQESPTPAADMRIVSGAAYGHLAGILPFQSSSVTIDCYDDTDMAVADQIAMAMMADGLLFGFTASVSGIYLRGVDPLSGISQSVEGIRPGSEAYRYVSSFSIRVHWAMEC
jgi:hypothetical protein